MILILQLFNLRIQFQNKAGSAINNRWKLGCPHRCYYDNFSITKSNLGTNTNGHENKISFWPMFNLPFVTVEEEYRLFDTVAIVSATGGSLGLFLGLSCYNVIWKGYECLEAALLRFKERYTKQDLLHIC